MRPIHAQVSHRMTTCNCKDMRRHHQSNAALHFTRPNRGLLYSISSAASRYCARRCAHTSKNQYLRRTCSWFRGPWSQRRKLFTATATNVERTVDITSCGRWRRTEKSKWINIQKANQTAERFRGTMKPLRRKQCCAWAASLASKAGSVASKKEQQEENEKIRQTLKMF